MKRLRRLLSELRAAVHDTPDEALPGDDLYPDAVDLPATDPSAVGPDEGDKPHDVG